MLADWYSKVVVDYGDHDTAAPASEPNWDWPVRPDPFSTDRAGFEIRTYPRHFLKASTGRLSGGWTLDAEALEVSKSISVTPGVTSPT